MLPKTEMRNPKSIFMDRMDTEPLTRLLITANFEAVQAVEAVSDVIADAVDLIARQFENGGRLFYVGAGTSGRLGVLDAAECPPTFGVSPDLVCGILAGGRERMFCAAEHAEDDYDSGCRAVREYGIREQDVVVGISAAGTAAFVTGAMTAAKALGCSVVGIACNADTSVLQLADIPILIDTGAEVLTGSTRLKAGTAQKIVLNTLTTGAMVKTGKVYENMMINLSPSNQKLRERVIRIVCEILSCTEEEAVKRLETHAWKIREAVASAQQETKGIGEHV